MVDEASASPLGPNPRVAAAIAYAGWWASGALVWLVERDRPAVRFHAMQSMIAFGIVFTAWITCWIGSFLMLVSSASGFFGTATDFAADPAGGVHRLGGVRGAGAQGRRGAAARHRRLGGTPDVTRYISPFQSSGSGLTERNVSRCHLPPPHGSITSVAMTSTRISANVRPSGSPSR